MAHPYDRAKAHDGKQLKLPSGEQAEVNFPIETPGEAGYHSPTSVPSQTRDNTGDKPTKKPGKNF